MFIDPKHNLVSALRRSAMGSHFAPTEREITSRVCCYKHFASPRRGTSPRNLSCQRDNLFFATDERFPCRNKSPLACKYSFLARKDFVWPRKQSFRLRKQSFRVRKQSFRVRKQSFRVRKQSFRVRKQSFRVRKQSFRVRKQSFQARKQSI